MTGWLREEKGKKFSPWTSRRPLTPQSRGLLKKVKDFGVDAKANSWIKPSLRGRTLGVTAEGFLTNRIASQLGGLWVSPKTIIAKDVGQRYNRRIGKFMSYVCRGHQIIRHSRQRRYPGGIWIKLTGFRCDRVFP